MQHPRFFILGIHHCRRMRIATGHFMALAMTWKFIGTAPFVFLCYCKPHRGVAIRVLRACIARPYILRHSAYRIIGATNVARRSTFQTTLSLRAASRRSDPRPSGVHCTPLHSQAQCVPHCRGDQWSPAGTPIKLPCHCEPHRGVAIRLPLWVLRIPTVAAAPSE